MKVKAIVPSRSPKPAKSADVQPTLRRRKTSVSVRKRSGDKGWELVHPACALEREDDVAEAEQMIAAGETEVARDELLWLLTECRDLIAAHRLLGELALTDGDFRLARAHFGHAFEIGWSALPAAGLKGALAYDAAPNRAFLESAKGLAHALRELEKHAPAREVAEILFALDPADPLGVREWLGG